MYPQGPPYPQPSAPQATKRGMATWMIVLIVSASVVILTVVAAIILVIIFSDDAVKDQTRSAVCDADRATLETAQEVYRVKTGYYATDESVLVSAGLISDQSPNFDTDSTGKVFPTASSGCSP